MMDRLLFYIGGAFKSLESLLWAATPLPFPPPCGAPFWTDGVVSDSEVLLDCFLGTWIWTAQCSCTVWGPRRHKIH